MSVSDVVSSLMLHVMVSESGGSCNQRVSITVHFVESGDIERSYLPTKSEFCVMVDYAVLYMATKTAARDQCLCHRGIS